MDRPSYYSIIPAEVRYDQNLTANAKLLYAEITSLCQKDGTCWASNQYFENLYNAGKTTVQRWLNELKKGGYIKVVIHPLDGNVRHITLAPKMGPPSPKNGATPSPKNGAHNNTSMNIKNNNKESIKESAKRFLPPTPEELQQFSRESNLGLECERFLDYYTANGWKVGKNKMKDWKAAARNWARGQRRYSHESDIPDTEEEAKTWEHEDIQVDTADILSALKEGL